MQVDAAATLCRWEEFSLWSLMCMVRFCCRVASYHVAKYIVGKFMLQRLEFKMSLKMSGLMVWRVTEELRDAVKNYSLNRSLYVTVDLNRNL